ncbi:MAG: hypothetical protein ACQERZ_05135 [Fusobacteriota bacterium]
MNKKRNIIMIFLFFLLNSFLFSEFEDVSNLEKIIYGFTYTNSKTLEAIPTMEVRMSNLEKKILGETGEGKIKLRAKKLIHFLYNDTKTKSIVTRLERLEIRIFSQINNRENILSRIENIEEKAYGKFLRNNGSIIDRLEKLESYFEIKEER